MATMADCQTLVNLLSNNQADTTTFASLYSDVMNDLGMGRWHTTTATLTYTEGTSTVSLPALLLDTLAIIYDDTQLSNLELRELESLKNGWRNVKGSPVAYTTQAETVKSVEVFPVPDVTLSGTVVYAENRTNCLAYLVLPIALLVLEREFIRQSDHSDVAFATVCGNLGRILVSQLSTEDNFQQATMDEPKVA